MPERSTARPKPNMTLHDELNAVALLTQAIVQDGHLTEAYLLRAEILRAMGSLTEAEADIDHLLESEEARPAPEEAVMLKAALRLQQGDAPTAITYYNKVKTQNPLMGEAYVGLSTHTPPTVSSTGHCPHWTKPWNSCRTSAKDTKNADASN